jgi:hypothetical protein
MTNPDRLERRYRSLLALYPEAYRDEHAEEILAVLMAAATEGQTRPRPAEAADLVRGAVRMRVRRTTVPTPWEYRHTRLMLPVRIVTGLWLVVLTAVLYASGHLGWWGVVLAPAAALQFFIVSRLVHRPPQAPGAARPEADG